MLQTRAPFHPLEPGAPTNGPIQGKGAEISAHDMMGQERPTRVGKAETGAKGLGYNCIQREHQCVGPDPMPCPSPTKRPVLLTWCPGRGLLLFKPSRTGFLQPLQELKEPKEQQALPPGYWALSPVGTWDLK